MCQKFSRKSVKFQHWNGDNFANFFERNQTFVVCPSAKVKFRRRHFEKFSSLRRRKSIGDSGSLGWSKPSHQPKFPPPVCEDAIEREPGTSSEDIRQQSP